MFDKRSRSKQVCQLLLSLIVATRQTASYILFSAKTQTYQQNTYTQSGVEKSLFQFSLCLLI